MIERQSRSTRQSRFPKPAHPSPTAYGFLNGRASFALAKAHNADRISITQHEMACGDARPDHVHPDEGEILHVLVGELNLHVRDASIQARAGNTVLVPRGIPHAFTVTSPGVARFITVTRDGSEDVVRGVSRPAETEGLPPFVAPSPEMRTALAAECDARGITPLGPRSP